jgi:plastocyanin
MVKGFTISVILFLLLIIGIALFNFYEKNEANVKDMGEVVPSSIDTPFPESGGVEEMIIEEDKVEKVEENLEKGNYGTNEPDTFTIEITSWGFSPENLEIKKGDRVIFLNKDTENHWPASDDHPTHRKYPKSDISKCKSEVFRGETFDACHGLNLGERFSFEFNEKGIWRYHDHLRTNLKGSIIVE